MPQSRTPEFDHDGHEAVLAVPDENYLGQPTAEIVETVCGDLPADCDLEERVGVLEREGRRPARLAAGPLVARRRGDDGLGADVVVRPGAPAEFRHRPGSVSVGAGRTRSVPAARRRRRRS